MLKHLLTSASIFLCINVISQPCYNSTIKYGDNSKTGKYVHVNEIQIYYEMYGDESKQPLLLIHGNGGSIWSERCQIEYFREKYLVIIADNRYHGKSENGTEKLTFNLMAKDYYELLNHLKMDAVNIIGQSDGGIIGLLLAINYPSKVKKLVTTSPNLRPDTTAIHSWGMHLINSDLASVNNKIKSGDIHKSTTRDREHLKLLASHPNIKNNELQRIKSPVLVMAGDEDIIKLSHILEIYNQIPHSQLFIMPGATHFMLRNKHGLFNQITDSFLSHPFKRPTTKALLVK